MTKHYGAARPDLPHDAVGLLPAQGEPALAPHTVSAVDAFPVPAGKLR
jgi:hypothetical protein